MPIIKECIQNDGKSLFNSWFNGLNSEAVHEFKIDFGPGYRLYFGMEGEEIIILLLGGTKKRQSKDIKLAKQKWREYKSHKRKEN